MLIEKIINKTVIMSNQDEQINETIKYFENKKFHDYSNKIAIFYSCKNHENITYYVSDISKIDPMTCPNIVNPNNDSYCGCDIMVIGYGVFGSEPGRVVEEYFNLQPFKFSEIKNITNSIKMENMPYTLAIFLGLDLSKNEFTSKYFKDNKFHNYTNQVIVYYYCSDHEDIAYFVSDDLDYDPNTYPDVHGKHCLNNGTCYFSPFGYVIFGNEPGVIIFEYIDLKFPNKYFLNIRDEYIQHALKFDKVPQELEKFKNYNLLVKSATKLD